MASEALTAQGYIHHHLTNLTLGVIPDKGCLTIAHNAAEAKAMGFWSINLDTLFFSILLGMLFLWFFKKVANNATSGVPGPMQNFAEWIIDFVEEMASFFEAACSPNTLRIAWHSATSPCGVEVPWVLT